SSGDMKSAKAAVRSALVVGSSTIWISRVNGSSSATITGRLGTSGLLRLEGDPERGEYAVMHYVSAGPHGPLHHLAFAVVLTHGLEHCVRHLGTGDHGIDIGERCALGLAEEA